MHEGENMLDRIAEIRARLDAYNRADPEAAFYVLAHAPADIAWLLDGYALAVDLIAVGAGAMGEGGPYEQARARILAAWGVTEDDIAAAKERDPRHA
jgi:hypothetical protein